MCVRSVLVAQEIVALLDQVQILADTNNPPHLKGNERGK